MTSSSLLVMVGPKSLKLISLIVGLPIHFKPNPNSNMVSERVWSSFLNSRLYVWMSSLSGPISQISGYPSGCPIPEARSGVAAAFQFKNYGFQVSTVKFQLHLRGSVKISH